MKRFLTLLCTGMLLFTCTACQTGANLDTYAEPPKFLGEVQTNVPSVQAVAAMARSRQAHIVW